MELRHLRYFVAVAEELSFRRAAGRLHIAQPPLSAQIKQLEEELEVRLLERDSHKVALTAAGAVFLEHARRLLREATEAVFAGKRAARGETGRTSNGFVASLAHGVLPGILRAFRRRYPEVQLQLSEMVRRQRRHELFLRDDLREETARLMRKPESDDPEIQLGALEPLNLGRRFPPRSSTPWRPDSASRSYRPSLRDSPPRASASSRSRSPCRNTVTTRPGASRGPARGPTISHRRARGRAQGGAIVAAACFCRWQSRAGADEKRRRTGFRLRRACCQPHATSSNSRTSAP